MQTSALSFHSFAVESILQTLMWYNSCRSCIKKNVKMLALKHGYVGRNKINVAAEQGTKLICEGQNQVTGLTASQLLSQSWSAGAWDVERAGELNHMVHLLELVTVGRKVTDNLTDKTLCRKQEGTAHTHTHTQKSEPISDEDRRTGSACTVSCGCSKSAVWVRK